MHYFKITLYGILLFEVWFLTCEIKINTPLHFTQFIILWTVQGGMACVLANIVTTHMQQMCSSILYLRTRYRVSKNKNQPL